MVQTHHSMQIDQCNPNGSTMNDKNDPLESLSFARRKLNENSKDLDADTREKLMQIRHRAMESSLEGESNFPDWATLPIIAFVTAVIFVLLIYVKPGSTPQVNDGPEDLELLLSKNPIEFYENLEFLQNWEKERSEKETN
jgi:hypothetical protein